MSTRLVDVVPDRDKDSERRLRNMRNAQATCRCCAKCGRKLAADAPIWRERLLLGYGDWTIAPVCKRCIKDDPFSFSSLDFQPEQPCVTCGRPVHDNEGTASARRWTTCCEACARAARATAARQRRSDARGTGTCATCGETFEPTRSDARFCSSACRQRAYRRVRKDRTVTDDELRTDRSCVISRNGVGPLRMMR